MKKEVGSRVTGARKYMAPRSVAACADRSFDNSFFTSSSSSARKLTSEMRALSASYSPSDYQTSR
eukprot:4217810-Pleurochrysis_carterae.AAC.1